MKNAFGKIRALIAAHPLAMGFVGAVPVPFFLIGLSVACGRRPATGCLGRRRPERHAPDCRRGEDDSLGNLL
jgi:hypothetical protein